MKKIAMAAILGLCLNSVSAQMPTSLHVPDAIKKDFINRYPHARKIDWTNGPEGYQVSFETRYKKCFIVYDVSGNSVGQTVEIFKANLPRSIRKKLVPYASIWKRGPETRENKDSLYPLHASRHAWLV